MYRCLDNKLGICDSSRIELTENGTARTVRTATTAKILTCLEMLGTTRANS